jgi:hypothetical protein
VPIRTHKTKLVAVLALFSWFATYGKIEWIEVEKYGQGLPIGNLQVIDDSGIGNTQPLADRLRAEKRRFTAHCDRLRQH